MFLGLSRLPAVLLAIAGTLGPNVPLAAQEALPAVRIENVRRVFDNGEHNAFTDLVRWQGKYWLTFRSCPDGHMVHSSSSILILCSDDAQTWEEAHRFAVPLRDVRDPHFLVFREKLFVYTGTWYSGHGELPREDYDINKHLGFAVWCEDGKQWHGPRQLEGTYGHYIWRAATDGDTAFLCGRRKTGFSEAESGAGGARLLESALLESDDGLNWKYRSLFQAEKGNETAFKLLPDRSIVSLSRERGEQAQLAWSKPPYDEWRRKELPLYVGGPMLEPWGNHWLVGGRRNTDSGPRTAIYWLHDEQLHLIATLPSGGDNSYPGFVVTGADSGLLSWYSSHEKDERGHLRTAIYLADLKLE